MTISEVIAQERDALMAEYLYPEAFLGSLHLLPYCAIPDTECLINTPSYLRLKHHVRIEELGGKRKGEGFVQHCPSLRYQVFWAHVDNDGYKDGYIQFLATNHGINVTVLPATHHVDHLFNRRRARAMQLPWVRMGLIPNSINFSHGGGYEKARTQVRIGSVGRQRAIDEITLMKLWGVSSPRKGMPLSSEMMGHAERMAGLFGIPAAEIKRNIGELMEVAAFRPAR